VSGVTKRFPGTLALDDFDFDVEGGEVHALLGENGAGKSTFIKVLAGVHAPDGGQIRLAGAPLPPARRADTGIAFIHQDLALVDSMSVMENIGHVSGFPRRAGLISWRALYRQAADTLEALEAAIDPTILVSRLSHAQKSIVAIARAVTTPRVRLLVLDEPTASLPEEDVARVFRALELLKARGVGMIFVSHRLDEVFRIADRVTVMRDGRRVITCRIQEAKRDAIVEAIIGRAPGQVFVRDHAHRLGSTVVEFDAVAAGSTGPCSFSVSAGEIVALVGLEGAGQTDMSRLLVGDAPLTSGRIRFLQRPYEQPTAGRSIALGIGFVSAKRGVESVAAERTIRENLFINPSIPNRVVGRWINPRREQQDAHNLIRRFRIRGQSPEMPVAALSGGNQQKVVLARWLAADRKLLVLEEPTAGVDVGAKAEIYRLLLDSLAHGCAVLLVSSDFEEVSGIASRALVFYRGRIAAEVDAADLSISRLVHAATGETPARVRHG
jgi:ribose transport system ATP-binding protein